MSVNQSAGSIERLLVLPPVAQSFWRVAGLAVVQRTVLAAQRAGFSHIVVWAPQGSSALESLMQEDARFQQVRVVAELPEGHEAWAIVPSDIVFSPEVFEEIRACDGERATRWIAGELTVAVSGPWELLAAALRGQQQVRWDCLVAMATAARTLKDEVALRIEARDSVHRAEQALCKKIWRDASASDGVLAHWFDRHLSLAISRRLARVVWLRPNYVTVFGTTVGLAAAWLFSQGTFGFSLFGAVLFWFACVIDGCDGELARLTYRDSRWGEVFDVTTDNIVHAAIFLGLGVGYARAHPDGPYGWLLFLLLGGFVCAGLASFVFLRRQGGAEPSFSRSRWRRAAQRWIAALMNRDFAYILLLLAVADRLHWFLWGAAFGSYGVAVVALLLAAPMLENGREGQTELEPQASPSDAR
ncbi:CDP-diacylglycerol--inositol 3-phosphatidyltransferase [bacterium HR30]|nr:CDP-diacylglycerol--inositol 3-phosphatidyltransferase [bacterium HR30]